MEKYIEAIEERMDEDVLFLLITCIIMAILVLVFLTISIVAVIASNGWVFLIGLAWWIYVVYSEVNKGGSNWPKIEKYIEATVELLFKNPIFTCVAIVCAVLFLATVIAVVSILTVETNGLILLLLPVYLIYAIYKEANK